MVDSSDSTNAGGLKLFATIKYNWYLFGTSRGTNQVFESCPENPGLAELRSENKVQSRSDIQELGDSKGSRSETLGFLFSNQIVITKQSAFY